MFLSSLSMVLLLAVSAVEGSGALKTEARAVEAFTRVRASGAYELVITQAESFRVEVTADDNLLLLLSTRVKDGVLLVSEEKALRPRTPIKVNVAMPRVDGVELSGALTTTVRAVRGDRLDVAQQGAGRTDVDAAVTRITVRASGSGDLQLAGRADDLDVDVSGASRVDAAAVSALRARVNAGGACSVSVAPSQLLDATANGTASIRHPATVRDVRRKVSGMAVVRAL